MTAGQEGEVGKEGFGRMPEESDVLGRGEGGQERRAEGYGGDGDMDKGVGG